MLGERPRPLLRTTSKSILIPGDGFDGQPAGFCHNSLVSEKHPGPALSDPRQVVIGFDLGAENKPSDACESPRSVLDPNVHSPPQEKQAAARSPRSCLGILLSGKKGSQGVGLGIIIDIQAEEEADAKGSFFSAVPTAGHSQAISTVQNHLHQHSQPISIVRNCLHQPISIARGHDRDSEVTRYGIANSLPKPSQDKETDWALEVSTPEGMDDEIAPWQEAMEDVAEISIRQSIFSAASPPSNCCSFDMPSVGFLNVCFFCGCSLLQGKDIFMYSGDQAFCSAECRYERIVIDERKERKAVAAHFYPTAFNHHHRF